ncbi:MAG: alpha/beta hydrolase [Desulfobacterales bacterium]|nr:alpha/beta hydrolase [Desulfobacterales bacterium]
MFKIAAGAFVLYAAYCGLIFLAQRPVMFPRQIIQTPARPDLSNKSGEVVWVPTEFGQVEAWYLKPQTGVPPYPIMIVAHGNGELIDDNLADGLYMAARGIGVLLVEYPGYGRSPGRPSMGSISETFTNAYDLITRRPEVDASKVVLFGRSLGGGAVCDLSRHRPSAAMILMCTFTDTRFFVKRYLAPASLTRDPFDNLEAVSEYQSPVLIIHGRQDEVIPWEHGRRLYEASPNGQMVSYDCGHNDFPLAFRETIVDFLNPHIMQKKEPNQSDLDGGVHEPR